ncbi:ribosome maturation factor RimM [Chloroflexota bacterium]
MLESAMKQEFITIGKILSPWGVKGKLKVEVTTDLPQRFIPFSEVYVGRQPMTITSTNWHKGKAIITLNTVDSIEDAEKLRGQLVEIQPDQLHPLPRGQYYHFQLIGLDVWTTQGELLGNITEILPTPGNDNYVVRGAKGEILIPAIEDVVKSIDLDKGCLTIEPIKGLLSLNQKAAG